MRLLIHSISRLALICCMLASIGCKHDEPQERGSQDRTPATVGVVTLKTEKVTSAMEIMGTTRAVEKAVIAARISGHILELPVVLGSRVTQGEILVKINASDIAAQLVQANAQLAQADRNLKREQSLLKQTATTPETVKALEDAYRIAEASVNEVKTMLDYATIYAPFTGIITQKNANIGDLAVPGKPLLELEDQTNLQVVANIPESMILKIHVGDDISLTIPSAGFSSACKVKEVSPAADPMSHTAPIKLALPANASLRSGQFARIVLPQGTTDAMYLPRSAVLAFGQMERVFQVVDGKARLRLVRTGAVQNDRIEILAGLKPGDEIISTGNKDLVDGQPVMISR